MKFPLYCLLKHLSRNLIDDPEFEQLEEAQNLYDKEMKRLQDLSQQLKQVCDNFNHYLNNGKPRPAFESSQPLETKQCTFPTAPSAGNLYFHPVMYYGPVKNFTRYPNFRIDTGSVTICSSDNILNASTSTGGGVKIIVGDQGRIRYGTVQHPDLVLINLRPLSSLIPSVGLAVMGNTLDFQLPNGGLLALVPRTILGQINKTVFTVPSNSLHDVATAFTDYIEALELSFHLVFYVKGISQN